MHQSDSMFSIFSWRVSERLGSAPVRQQLRMLIRRPEISVSCWGTRSDPPYWSERRRPKSGGTRMKRRRAGVYALQPCLTIHACPRSPCSHGCLCPSASETGAGKKLWKYPAQDSKERTVTVWSVLLLPELKCTFQGSSGSSNTKLQVKKATYLKSSFVFLIMFTFLSNIILTLLQMCSKKNKKQPFENQSATKWTAHRLQRRPRETAPWARAAWRTAPRRNVWSNSPEWECPATTSISESKMRQTCLVMRYAFFNYIPSSQRCAPVAFEANIQSSQRSVRAHWTALYNEGCSLL